MHRFSQKGEDITDFLSLKVITIMKKMLLIVAVAFAAMSCGNKCCEKAQEAEAAEAVEVVEAEPVEAEADSAAVEVVEVEAAEVVAE